MGLLDEEPVGVDDPWLELVELQGRDQASRRIFRMSLFAWTPLVLLSAGAVVGIATILIANR